MSKYIDRNLIPTIAFNTVGSWLQKRGMLQYYPMDFYHHDFKLMFIAKTLTIRVYESGTGVVEINGNEVEYRTNAIRKDPGMFGGTECLFVRLTKKGDVDNERIDAEDVTDEWKKRLYG